MFTGVMDRKIGGDFRTVDYSEETASPESSPLNGWQLKLCSWSNPQDALPIADAPRTPLEKLGESCNFQEFPVPSSFPNILIEFN